MSYESEDTVSKMKSPWRNEAACLPIASDVEGLEGAWINEEHPGKSEAEHVCKEVCPVRRTCLIDALVDVESEGMRGGYWFSRGGLAVKDRDRLKREFPMFQKVTRLRKRGSRITNGEMVS